MKKIFFLMSAIALLGLTSCVDQIDKSKFNPNYDSETNSVLTNFVFSVSTGNTPTTKMTEANTQASLTNTFRGLTDAVLATYKLGQNDDGKNLAAPAAPNKSYQLGNLIASNGLKPSSTTAGDILSHRVVELALPVETNTLLFWGFAPKAAPTLATDDMSAIQGKITKSFATDGNSIADTRFTLEPRVNGNQTLFENYQKFIAYMINYVMGATFSGSVTYSGSSVGSLSPTTAGGTSYGPFEVRWSDYVTISTTPSKNITVNAKSPIDATVNMTALGEILADAFIKFNTVYDTEIRAGSGEAVMRMMSDLYLVVQKVAESTPTTLSEVVAANVAQQIETRIGNIFQNAGLANMDWKTVANILSSVTSYTGTTTDVSNIKDFPSEPFHMPMGCCQLQVAYTSGDKATQKVEWSYASSLSMVAMGGGSVSVYNYMYPAELCYFGNSPIRVSTDSHVPGDYPDGTSNWDNDNSWIAGATGSGSVAWEKNTHVHSDTRSVAMRDNINYGSALLKSTVTYGAAVLKDHNHYIQERNLGTTLVSTEEPDKQIPVDGSSFTLKGIIVGGQNADAGWNYLPTTPAGGGSIAFDKMIYDSEIVDGTISGTPGTKSTPNYTLVWDNWDQSKVGSDQNAVFVCLELQNDTGEDFWGNENIIRNGGTFYLIGKLDPTTTSAANLSSLGLTAAQYKDQKDKGIVWPTNYALPPYDASGNTIQERRVFIQDYMTTANFVIGENSLKSAYVTVPDLRSTQISLGLSVNLEWQTGLVFDNIILGQ